MNKLVERVREMSRRCGDLRPIQETVREILWEGNRDAILAGVTPGGVRVDDLKPSTLKRRKGSGPPRAPRGAASRPISEYVVSVSAGPGHLSFTGSWPDFPEIEYVDRLRPTLGFRTQDLDEIRGLLTSYVVGGRNGR